MEALKFAKDKKGVSRIHSKDNPRAQIIRSKLIQDFNLLGHLQGLIINDPKYNMNDIKDSKMLNKLMIEDPLQLVRFDFNPVRNIDISSNHRQRNCLQNRYVKYPPLNMWAQWVLESILIKSIVISFQPGSFFRNLILYSIIINVIVFGVFTDVSNKPGPKFSAITTMLVVIDWCILSILTCEILLRWLDDFVNFWSSSWNVFDLAVLLTVRNAVYITIFIKLIIFLVLFCNQSLVPVAVKRTHLIPSIELHFLKVFRIFRALRSLKMMRTFDQVRLILLAITKAFKAMTFILLLVSIFAYVFAVVGVTLFRSYTQSNNPNLVYRSAFRGILHTLETLFQLFTLDHWHALLIDIWQVEEVDKVSSGIYIIVWILIGSFIFRNIIVGIMVSNFQTIRNDLSAQIRQLEAQRKADHFKLLMMQRRMSQQMSLKEDASKVDRQRETDLSAPGQSEFRTSSQGSHSSDGSHKSAAKDWDSYVRKNIKLLKNNQGREKVIWPRDSLFRYYELLEQLQYNLEERKKLQLLAAQALLNMHDV
ncbi:cation channel sperm-associated protein 2-like [Heptranchias perlo]|uniref:cation channel sperm-associated protein 2-like n=1 Tax=Heptranchias perlo TaxID=212740 RepID=UPI00355A1403